MAGPPIIDPKVGDFKAPKRSPRNEEVEEIAIAQTPRNMVSDGSHVGGVCDTPGRECLF